jgi:hypothetical protein
MGELPKRLIFLFSLGLLQLRDFARKEMEKVK